MNVFEAVAAEIGDVQGRCVPGHVGMIPGDPREPLAVGTQPRITDEIAVAEEHGPAALPPVTGTLTMAFFASPDPVWSSRTQMSRAPEGSSSPSGIPEAFGRQRNRRGAGLLRVQLVIGEVAEVDDIATERIGNAAIFVNARSRVEAPGRQLGDGAVGGRFDDDVTPAFRRTAFEPVRHAVERAHVRERDGGAGRGRPRRWARARCRREGFSSAVSYWARSRCRGDVGSAPARSSRVVYIGKSHGSRTMSLVETEAQRLVDGYIDAVRKADLAAFGAAVCRRRAHLRSVGAVVVVRRSRGLARVREAVVRFARRRLGCG